MKKYVTLMLVLMLPVFAFAQTRVNLQMTGLADGFIDQKNYFRKNTLVTGKENLRLGLNLAIDRTFKKSNLTLGIFYRELDIRYKSYRVFRHFDASDLRICRTDGIIWFLNEDPVTNLTSHYEQTYGLYLGKYFQPFERNGKEKRSGIVKFLQLDKMFEVLFSGTVEITNVSLRGNIYQYEYLGYDPLTDCIRFRKNQWPLYQNFRFPSIGLIYGLRYQFMSIQLHNSFALNRGIQTSIFFGIHLKFDGKTKLEN